MALYDEAYVATQRARIRELEAELADCKRLLGGGLTDTEWLDLICERYALVPKVRAEKAEKALDELVKPFDESIPHVSTPGSPFHLVWSFLKELNDAKARVAELRELLIGAHVGGPEWERKVADAIYGQAREREEC